MRTTFPESDPNGRDLHRQSEFFSLPEFSRSSVLGIKAVNEINDSSASIAVLRREGNSASYKTESEYHQSRVIFYSGILVAEDVIIENWLDNFEMERIITGVTRIKDLLNFNDAYDWLPEFDYGQKLQMIEGARRDPSFITNIKTGNVPMIVNRLINQNKKYQEIIFNEIISEHKEWFDSLKK